MKVAASSGKIGEERGDLHARADSNGPDVPMHMVCWTVQMPFCTFRELRKVRPGGKSKDLTCLNVGNCTHDGPCHCFSQEGVNDWVKV